MANIPSPDDIRIQKNIERLLTEMPYYILDYYYEKSHNTSFRTLEQYLIRYKFFLNYLAFDKFKLNKEAGYTIKDVTIEQLENLRKADILDFISKMKSEDVSVANRGKTEEDEEYDHNKVTYRVGGSIALLITSLKSLFRYLSKTSEDEFGKTYIHPLKNVMEKIDIPNNKETSASRADKISSKLLDPDSLFKFVEYLEDMLDKGYYTQLTVPQSKGLFKRDKERDIAMISLLLATGMRVGELARIQMADINYASQTIRITRKGGKVDTVYIMDSAFERLMTYIKIRNSRYRNAEQCPFLFVTYHKPAQAIRIRTIQQFVEKYTRSYFKGSNGVFPHKLRHSFAVAFVKNGGELSILQNLLGHSDIKTTGMYVNMHNSDRRASLDAFEGFLMSRSKQGYR